MWNNAHTLPHILIGQPGNRDGCIAKQKVYVTPVPIFKSNNNGGSPPLLQMNIQKAFFFTTSWVLTWARALMGDKYLSEPPTKRNNPSCRLRFVALFSPTVGMKFNNEEEEEEETSQIGKDFVGTYNTHFYKSLIYDPRMGHSSPVGSFLFSHY